MKRLAGPAALLTACWLAVWWADTRITDVFIYRHYADLLAAGVRPYSDGFALEYPPLALVPMWLARALGGSGAGFETAFGVLMGASALATLVLVDALGGRRAAWAFAITPLLAGAVLRTHFDMVAALALLAALLAFARGHSAAAFALLGAGTMLKGFPVVVVPVAGAWLWASGERRAVLRGVAAFAAVIAVVSLPFLGDGYADAYRFHLDRPVQVESTPAVVLYALGGTRVTGSTVMPDRFGSNGLVAGPSDAVEAVFAALALGTLVLLAYLATLRREVDHLLLCAAAAVVAFVALGKVFSPQYVAWLAPVGALAWAWGRRAPALLIALAILLTRFEFPSRYFALVEGDGGVRALVAVRDAALLVALGLLTAEAAGAARSSRPAAAPSNAPARP